MAAGRQGVGVVWQLRILSSVCSTTGMVAASSTSLMVVVSGVAAGFAVASSQGGSVKLSEVVTDQSTTGHCMEANATAVVIDFDPQVSMRAFVAVLPGCAQITCRVPSPLQHFADPSIPNAASAYTVTDDTLKFNPHMQHAQSVSGSHRKCYCSLTLVRSKLLTPRCSSRKPQKHLH